VTGGEHAVTLMGRTLPAWARVRLLTLGPGQAHPYVDAEWRGALVVVERGAVELEWAGGRRSRCERGDVLYLAGLPLRALRNAAGEPAMLSAVSRG
jgi:hypothetical protein